TKAFARDVNAQLPSLPIASVRAANGTLIPQRTTKIIYAATAKPAVKPPIGYYHTMVRFPYATASFGSNDGPGNDINDIYPSPGSIWAAPTSLSTMLDYGRRVTSELSLDSASTALSDDVMRQVNMYLA